MYVVESKGGRAFEISYLRSKCAVGRIEEIPGQGPQEQKRANAAPLSCDGFGSCDKLE